jgi:uncharacterized RDD family membrane protein YckC
VAERLAAHRNRRGHAQTPIGAESARLPEAMDERAARIVAAVAERYARSQSYRAYLAAEAERAVQQAQAAAEVAALNAQAMLAAQQTLLETLRRDSFDAEVAKAEFEVAALEAKAATEVAANLDGDAIGSAVDREAEFQETLPREMRLWPDAEAEIGAIPKPRSRLGTAYAGTRKAAKVKSSGAAMAAASPLTRDAEAASEAQQTAPYGQAADGGLRVRLYDESAGTGLANAAHETGSYGAGASLLGGRTSRPSYRQEDWYDAESLALDEEIAFRQAPVFEEPAGPPMPLPANLIEFPRHLVASRKARPRLAEGPLREGAEAVPGVGQLRIFEVDPAQINTTPVSVTATMPQWTSIWLDSPGHTPAEGDAAAILALDEHSFEGPAMPGGRAASLPQVASIGRRVAASAIDGGVVLAGFVAFAGAFLLTSDRNALWQPDAPVGVLLRHGLHTIAGQVLLQPGMVLAASACAFGLLYLLYQALFFSLSGATPGMRCARIALCTFAEENPARSAMLGRIVAALLSACPLGLGFLWAALDEDRLTWHDRVSRMYQRSY